jgi:flavin reductase (DIM6/NTAB) family NADH-FMN oxidoreductase RutF
VRSNHVRPHAPRLTDYKDALALVTTAVSVTATVDATGQPRAVTIGSLGALSLEPPLVLFCLSRDSRSHDVFRSATRYAITVLAGHQADIARRLAGPGRGPVSLTLADGLPTVPGGLAYLICTAHSQVDGGDHTILIGRVTHTHTSWGEPLLYHRRAYWTTGTRRG